MRSILDEVIFRLNTEKNGYCRVTHKKGWLEFLEDGDLVFAPHDLHEVLIQVFDSMRPRGEMLLYPRKCGNFTVTSKNKPYRKEEALERFITASNSGSYCNQFPIRGRKESSDIAIINEDSRHELIELKPWRSGNSPLYAVIESLKNLIGYRTIKDKSIKHHKNFKSFLDVDLIVLAPQSYYQYYKLIDDSGERLENGLKVFKKTLKELGSEFKTKISLMILPLSVESFDEKCQAVCKKYKKTTGQEIICISESDFISELARDNWVSLESSD